MNLENFVVGERLYTVFNTKGRYHDTWQVKVETVMKNRLFEERLLKFHTLDGAVSYIKAMRDEVK
jgi:hypothetical protein